MLKRRVFTSSIKKTSNLKKVSNKKPKFFNEAKRILNKNNTKETKNNYPKKIRKAIFSLEQLGKTKKIEDEGKIVYIFKYNKNFKDKERKITKEILDKLSFNLYYKANKNYNKKRDWDIYIKDNYLILDSYFNFNLFIIKNNEHLKEFKNKIKEIINKKS